MNVLVTGGAGYIGSATAEALLQAGRSVAVLDSLVTCRRTVVPAGACFVQADLGQRPDVHIHRELGWRPRIPSLHNIIASAWGWRRTHPDGDGS